MKNTSFEQWCMNHGREKTLSQWDLENNGYPPSLISPFLTKKVYLKCCKCGYRWMSRVKELSNLDLEESFCPNCEKEKIEALYPEVFPCQNEKRSSVRKKKNRKIESFYDTIPFERAIEMSYDEYTEYLLKKYGSVDDDYFRIVPRQEFELQNAAHGHSIPCKHGDYVILHEKEIPLFIGPGRAENYIYRGPTQFLVDGFEYNIFRNGVYWFYPEEDVYINWSQKGRKARSSDGLVVHHIDEDKAEKLNDPIYACSQPILYQRKERLLYCDFVEHYLLHYKIGSWGGKAMISADIKAFLRNEISERWQIPCAKRVQERIEDVHLLFERRMIFHGEE